MELTIHVDPVGRTVRLREVHALAAGDSCSVVLEGVRGADVSSLRLALYRDAVSKSPVASCPSFAPVRGHPNLATGDLRLDTAEMAAWFDAVAPEAAQTESGPGRSRPEDSAERAVRTDGWMVVSDPGRTWAACRVPVILRPGAGISDVVDPTSLQALVEGLVSAAMSGALASKADKATTLAGYGITDAATKSELDSVNQSVANAISGVQSELSTKADLVDGKVPAAQLPAFVDDVLEYDAVSAFPATGEDGKIYVAKNTNLTYRWSGTQYVEISPSLALGETSETAYPGDKGAANASGIAALKKSKQDALNAQQLSAVNSGVTAEKISNMVTKDGVVPRGDGTETIATIGGKDIKAPASPVSSVNDKTGAVKLAAVDVGALALESANKVGSLFSMDFEGEETSGGNLSFGVGMGPAGRTFIANKLYCPDRLYANGFVITNTSGAPGESVLTRIQEYGGDYKTALDEVNGLVETAKRYSVVRPEASGNTYQLSDFAVNVVDLPSSGEYTFTFPPRTGGRVRDFVLKLNVTADPLPTVQFVKHPTDNDPPRFEGADGWSELELGVNFFGFTETS